uniref:Uncharacterized protein n=1 Tax=Romanomermis culicivorax TaxID=13658 RepID=A0A915KR50_ROMCU
MLKDILSLALAPLEEFMPIQPIAMDTKTSTATNDQTLTAILEEATTDNMTKVDIARLMLLHRLPPLDPRLYLVTQAVLPSSPMIPTIATARYIPPVRFLQQIISNNQWNALAAILKLYNFLPLPPGILFPEHHWQDYPQELQDLLQILLSIPTTAPAASQPVQIVQRTLIARQAAPVLTTAQLPQPAPMDIQPS